MRLLILSDLHLRDTAPTCRQESQEQWKNHQRKQIMHIMKVAEEESCDGILVAGDIFHRPRVSPSTEQTFMLFQNAPCPVFIMPGQHDLPGHSSENYDDCSFGVVWSHAQSTKQFTDGEIHPMDHFCDWEEYQSHKIVSNVKNVSSGILCVHRLVTPITSELPAKNAITTADLLDEFPEYQIIIAGDYHHCHYYVAPKRSEHAGRAVIVPGCMNIQAADFEGYNPCVSIIDVLDTGMLENIDTIPTEDSTEFFTSKHIKDKHEKEDRITAFIEATKNSKSMTFSFEDNVRAALEEGEYSETFRTVVSSYMEWN